MLMFSSSRAGRSWARSVWPMAARMASMPMPSAESATKVTRVRSAPSRVVTAPPRKANTVPSPIKAAPEIMPTTSRP